LVWSDENSRNNNTPFVRSFVHVVVVVLFFRIRAKRRTGSLDPDFLIRFGRSAGLTCNSSSNSSSVSNRSRLLSPVYFLFSYGFFKLFCFFADAIILPNQFNSFGADIISEPTMCTASFLFNYSARLVPFFLFLSSICVNACIVVVVVVVGGDFHSRDGSVRCYSGRIAPREKASWVPRVAAAAAATVPQN
jgi:hypothetical protein